VKTARIIIGGRFIMRRLKILLVVLALALLFTSCGGSGISLKEGQYSVNIKSNGDVTIEYLMSKKKAEKEFDIDFDDSNKDIIKDLEDYFDDNMRAEGKVTIKKKTKDQILFSASFKKGEMKSINIKNTLEDYADNYGIDVDELPDKMNLDFVYFKNGKDVDEDDLEKYEDYIAFQVSGDDEGVYFTFPGKIEIVSDIDFKRINDNTIFVEDGEFGLVVFKK
jgi:hypothetical protein